jgi:hypothetical protein
MHRAYGTLYPQKSFFLPPAEAGRQQDGSWLRHCLQVVVNGKLQTVICSWFQRL